MKTYPDDDLSLIKKKKKIHILLLQQAITANVIRKRIEIILKPIYKPNHYPLSILSPVTALPTRTNLIISLISSYG